MGGMPSIDELALSIGRLNPKPLERQKLWTVAEIAEYLSVEPRTVYVWVREKGMPARKAGDELRFDPDEVERWTMRDRETEKIIEKIRIRALR
jgi:excisionase family DNA binding protein